MIKTGIVGGANATAAQLLQLLLHHPDVDLQWVSSPPHVGLPIAHVQPSLVGDTDLTFCAVQDYEGLDLVFVCDDSAVDPQWVSQVPETVKLIDFSPRYRATDEEESGFTYGLSEVNRRRMVHDCNRVACPGDAAMALVLPLIPMAKNLMLNSEIHATLVVADDQATTGSRVRLLPPGHFADQLREVRYVLEALQSSFSSPIHLTAMQACFARGMLATVCFKSAIDVAMVRELFEQYYDDHRFTFVIDHYPNLADVVGTNKCLLHIEREDDYLRITSAIDNQLKGGVGTAVHAMNLIFGLHERVGLQL